MSVKFDVKMTDKAMYSFMLYHTYTSLSGILGVVFGIVTFVFGMRAISQGAYNSAIIFFMFTFLFIIFTPISLKNRSKRQVKTSPMFQKPITYELIEEGVKVSQDDQEVVNPWEDFMKAVEINGALVLYVTRLRALIFPKADLGEQYTAVVQMISTHMPPAKVKIKQVR